jgi:hypothetical protein
VGLVQNATALIAGWMLAVRSAVDGPVGDKIGLPVHLLAKDEHWGEPHSRLTGAHTAQGGVTLGAEQGEVRANFCYLVELKIRSELTFTRDISRPSTEIA